MLEFECPNRSSKKPPQKKNGSELAGTNHHRRCGSRISYLPSPTWYRINFPASHLLIISKRNNIFSQHSTSFRRRRTRDLEGRRQFHHVTYTPSLVIEKDFLGELTSYQFIDPLFLDQSYRIASLDGEAVVDASVPVGEVAVGKAKADETFGLRGGGCGRG